MSNIYDTANQLERDLRELQEFKTLMEAEQRLNTIMQDINRIITNPLQELYSAK